MQLSPWYWYWRRISVWICFCVRTIGGAWHFQKSATSLVRSGHESVPSVATVQYFHINPTSCADTMIDFGFVVAAFVPLVLFWMYVISSIYHRRYLTNLISALVTIIFEQFGVFPLALVSYQHWLSLSGA